MRREYFISLICLNLVAGVLVIGSSRHADGHGLIQDPPARNWFCGAITKPDEAATGGGQYPVCGQAFTAPGVDFTDGYSFMSVLTHTTGRAGIGPRQNVCSFDSETWNGRATVWDQPIDWPVNPMQPGVQDFVWNISWGPHFSDTQEFRYWITKPGFQFQVGQPLSFDDFETQPFCTLNYSDATPNANPNVTPNPDAATFTTRCTVPPRSGRHVIYAEWGRTPPTFERFHGCVDVVFDGDTPPPAVDARITLTPDAADFTGAGTITLDGRNSIGSGLTYRWSVDAANPGLYSITNADQAVATLTLDAPQTAANVTVSLVVSSGPNSDSATRTFTHRPESNSQWFDLGPLSAEARTLSVGERVSVRTVAQNGQDAYWPTTPLVITAAISAASEWPLALAGAVNAANGAVRIGVVNADDAVVPVQSATANRVYALTSAGITSAFLQVDPEAPPTGEVTIEAVVDANSPWFNQQQIRIANTAPLTSLSVTIVIARTTGLSHNGQYNTVGGQIEQSSSSTASTITYTFELESGETISAGTDRSFVAQTSGSGTIHPTNGDTYSVTYTVGGVTRTTTGAF